MANRRLFDVNAKSPPRDSAAKNAPRSRRAMMGTHPIHHPGLSSGPERNTDVIVVVLVALIALRSFFSPCAVDDAANAGILITPHSIGPTPEYGRKTSWNISWVWFRRIKHVTVGLSNSWIMQISV